MEMDSSSKTTANAIRRRGGLKGDKGDTGGVGQQEPVGPQGSTVSKKCTRH